MPSTCARYAALAHEPVRHQPDEPRTARDCGHAGHRVLIAHAAAALRDHRRRAMRAQARAVGIEHAGLDRKLVDALGQQLRGDVIADVLHRALAAQVGEHDLHAPRAIHQPALPCNS